MIAIAGALLPLHFAWIDQISLFAWFASSVFLVILLIVVPERVAAHGGAVGEAGHHGAELLLVPAAFTAHTGAAHWHLLLRARAVENQAWVVAAAE